MATVDELVTELEKQAEPYHAWEASRKDIHKGTSMTRKSDKYTKDTKGHDLVKKVEDYAFDFYDGMGIAGNRNKQALAQELRNILGDNYGAFRQSLKKGDIDKANNIARDAYELHIKAAEATPLGEKVGLLEPDDRVAFGKQLMKKIGGKDYVTIATNPIKALEDLSKQKAVAEAYK